MGDLLQPWHLIVILILVLPYFAPIMVAKSRNCKDLVGISIVNILLGWTFIGWVAALVWAVAGAPKRSIPFQQSLAPLPSQTAQVSDPSSVSLASVAINSTPLEADIEIDGSFVGNTPSTVALTGGSHVISISKNGYAPWSKTLNITTGNINVVAELTQAPIK